MQSLQRLLINLRELGFQISISEIIECNKLLKIAESRDELRLGIRMIVSKTLQEQELFDLAWKSYYAEKKPAQNIKKDDQSQPIDQHSQLYLPGDDGAGMDGAGMDGAGMDGAGMDGEGSMDPAIALMQFNSSFRGVANQLILGNERNAAAMMLRYLLGGYTVGEIQERRDQSVQEVAEMLETVVPDISSQLLANLEQQLDIILQERLLNPIRMGNNPLTIQNIEDLPLLHLDPSAELHLALRKLGKKLATRQKRRLRKGRKKINLRQTIRANIQRGGTLLELRRKRPRLTKPRLILVTDVSPSTIHATRLFLSIIWNAKDVFSNLRYFEFVGSCIEVTNEFRRAKSVNEGMEISIAKWDREIDGKENSDYYRAFRTFSKLVAPLTKQSSIIILGDLRDWLGPWKDGKPLSAKILGELRQKVNRMIVLNPEGKYLWDTSDSICKYCIEQDIEVKEATTLAQLIGVLLTL